MTETNLFDREDGIYLVLVNAEHQHSLWPQSLAVPDGWTLAYGPADRNSCLDYVDTHWTDLHPQSLAQAVDGQGDIGDVPLALCT